MTKKKSPDKKKKLGRPSVYNPTKHNKQAHELAELGATNEQIAEALNISTATFDTWKFKYPDFLSAIKTGKEITDDEVVRSLLSRAKGMKIRKTRIIQIGDERIETDGDGREWRVTAKRKEMSEDEIPPDPTAMIFWLKNRQPKDWRDKHEQEITGKDGAPLTVKILRAGSMDEL